VLCASTGTRQSPATKRSLVDFWGQFHVSHYKTHSKTFFTAKHREEEKLI